MIYEKIQSIVLFIRNKALAIMSFFLVIAYSVIKYKNKKIDNLEEDIERKDIENKNTIFEKENEHESENAKSNISKYSDNDGISINNNTTYRL